MTPAREIPRGLCQCGCGGRTSIAKKNRPEHGWVKGEPLRFINGHHSRGENHWAWQGGGELRDGAEPTLCQCGCGQAAPISDRTIPSEGLVIGMPRRFIYGHHVNSPETHPRWKGGRRISHGYVLVFLPEHPRAVKCYVREHILVVEAAMGRPLRLGAEVHHVNGVKSDNRPQNLVACNDAAYHQLLHVRQRALDACGNASWLHCYVCKTWDSPDRLRHHKHVECARTVRRARTLRERAA